MALKVRLIASQVMARQGLPTTIIYKAEAYDDDDRFREPIWSCPHVHHTVEHALNCGVTWLNERPDTAA